MASPLSRPAKVLLVGYLVLGLAERLTDLERLRLADTVILALLMPTLVAFVLTARRSRGRLTDLAVLALFFSWLGDTVGGLALLAKIGLFLVAQLVYVVAFWPYRGRSVLRRPVRLVGYLVCLAAAIAFVARTAGPFVPAVVVYGCALGAMAVLATGLNLRTTAGGIVFVLSDLSLATGVFGSGWPSGWLDPLVMPTYLCAQLLLAWGMLRGPRLSPVRAPDPGRPGGPVASAARIRSGTRDFRGHLEQAVRQA